MFKSQSILSGNILRFCECFFQPKRSTYILRRTRPTKLSKLGEERKKLRRKDFYYEVVENTNRTPKPLLDLVLVKDVPGIGMAGEEIQMSIYLSYRDLILPKLAVYADSPEAKLIAKESVEVKYSSIYTKLVENTLAKQGVAILLNNDNPWKLEPWHVKLALRKIGIYANEDCIRIPKEISGPDFSVENKDFIVYVTMNKKETFPLRCRIFHWSSSEPSLNQKKFNLQEPAEPLFPEEKEIVQAAIKMEEDLLKSEMLRSHHKKEKEKKPKRTKK